jgi:hypothetical protein
VSQVITLRTQEQNIDSFCQYRWLYILFLSIDGNFRLKLKNRKMADISLLKDWAYFVDEDKYLSYVKEHKGESYVRISPCQLCYNVLITSILGELL